MKRIFFSALLPSQRFCLLSAFAVSAAAPEAMDVDQNMAVLLNRVLRSEYGQGIEPITVA